MAKITKIDVSKSTYQGKEKKSYKFTLDDGKDGYCASDSDKKPWEYRVGDEVTYTNVVKTGKNGDYNNFTFKMGGNTTPVEKVSENAPHGAKTPGLPISNLPYAKIDIAEWKFQSRMQLCKLTHDLILAGKLSDTEAKTHLEAWSISMDELIDGIFS